MKFILALAGVLLGVSAATAQITPLQMWMDRHSDPSPVCLNLNSTDTFCHQIGTMSSGGVFSLNAAPVTYNVKSIPFDATGNGVENLDGVLASGSSTLTSAAGSFGAADVGKIIVVKGAGSAGADLITTISGVMNAQTVTLAAAASTTVSGNAADASIASGGYTLTTGSSHFSSSNVNKQITIAGAGPAGGPLVTTIQAVNSATSITLGDPASTTVSSAAWSIAARYYYGSDDTSAIQAALTQALATGGTLYFPRGVYLVTQELVGMPTGASNIGSGYLWQALYAIPTLRTLSIVGDSHPIIRMAKQTGTNLLTLQFNASINSVSPYYSKVEGIVLDCDGHISNGLDSNYTGNLEVSRDTFARCTNGVYKTGYGIGKYDHNTFVDNATGIYSASGGDDTIAYNDFYSSGTSIFFTSNSGNTLIQHNTFNLTQGLYYPGPLIAFAVDGTVSGTSARSVVFDSNECQGQDICVQINGSGTSANTYQFRITGNHTTPGVRLGAVINPGAMASISNASNVVIDGNQLGIPGTNASQTAVTLSSVSNFSVTGNPCTDMLGSCFYATNSTNGVIANNPMKDVGKSSPSDAAIVLDGTTSKVMVRGNPINQTSSSYAQTGVAEVSASTASNTIADNPMSNVATKYSCQGTGSVCGDPVIAPSAPQSFTPTVTCGAGTMTSYTASGEYWTYGKLVYISYRLITTTNGTCAGNVLLSLPLSAGQYAILAGREDAVNGNMLQGKINASGSTVSLLTYNNLYPAANGTQLIVSGSYLLP